MMRALLVGNPASAAGRHLESIDVPGEWLLEPAALTAGDLDGFDVLALFGGDGTMQRTLTQLLRVHPPGQLPPVAVLPFGTTNMNAADLNTTHGRRAAVASLRRGLEQGTLATHERRLLAVSDGSSTQWGFFLGIGAIASVVERWHAERGPGRVANQVRTLRKLFTGLTRAGATYDLVLNDQPLAIYGLLATTLDRLLFGCRPYWGSAAATEMRLTWVEAGAPALLKNAPALLRGKPRLAAEPGYESIATEHATLSGVDSFVVDGELFKPADGRLELGVSAPLRWVKL